MTRERLAELWPVMEAFRDGKAIQARAGSSEEKDWLDVVEPGWAPHVDYRIKPEPPKPREWWLLPGTAYCSMSVVDYKPVGPMAIHVREVLP